MIRRSVRSNVRAAILTAHNYICHYCGGSASEVDHIVSVKLGGNDSLGNLIASCYSCNRSKRGNALPLDQLDRAKNAALNVLHLLQDKFPDYSGEVYYTSHDTRKSVGLPASMWKEVTEWRHKNRIPTEAEAVRRLLTWALERRPTMRKAKGTPDAR